MRQIRWLDHVREKLAVWLAPWIVHDDIVEFHRGDSSQDRELS